VDSPDGGWDVLHGSTLHYCQNLPSGVADALGGSAIKGLGVVAFDRIKRQAVIFQRCWIASAKSGTGAA
jgi:hypothetical protein